MKKFSLLLAGAMPILMLGACASMNGNGDGYSSTTLTEEMPFNGFYHVGRNPSAVLDCTDPQLTTDPNPVDPAAHWEAGSITPTFNANGGILTKQVTVSQVINIKTPVACNDTCYRWVQSAVQDTTGWDDYSTCEATGTGQSQAWNDFYSAPKAQKAAKLAAAIKGVGPANAQALVDHNTFGTKPRSWSNFVRMIRDAQEQKVLTPGIADQVTSKYAIDNIQNLGYDAGTCTPVHHTDSQVVYTQVPYTCPAQRSYYGVEARSISTAVVPVTVNVGPSVMQSFERDQVSVNVDYNGQVFTLRDAQASTLNRFYFSNVQNPATPGAMVNQPIIVQNGQAGNVYFSERARVLVDLPSDILGQVQLNSAIKAVLFVVPVNMGARQPSQAADQMVLSYQVEQCDLQGHWYTAGIRTCGKYYTTQALKDVPLHDGINPVQTIASDADHKIHVTYQVSRRNSRFYNSNPLPANTLEQKAHK